MCRGQNWSSSGWAGRWILLGETELRNSELKVIDGIRHYLFTPNKLAQSPVTEILSTKMHRVSVRKKWTEIIGMEEKYPLSNDKNPARADYGRRTRIENDAVNGQHSQTDGVLSTVRHWFQKELISWKKYWKHSHHRWLQGKYCRRSRYTNRREYHFNTDGHGNGWWIYNTLIKNLDEPVLILTCDNIVELDIDILTKEYFSYDSPPCLIVPVPPVKGLDGDLFLLKKILLPNYRAPNLLPLWFGNSNHQSCCD